MKINLMSTVSKTEVEKTTGTENEVSEVVNEVSNSDLVAMKTEEDQLLERAKRVHEMTLSERVKLWYDILEVQEPGRWQLVGDKLIMKLN